MSIAGPCNVKCEGGGGSCNNTASAISASGYNDFTFDNFIAAGGCFLGICGGGASNQYLNNKSGASSASSNAQNSGTCPPNNVTNIESANISKSLMSYDNSTLIMNRSALNAISTSINQMIVNSITSTRTSSTINVSTLQQIKIRISGVGGDVNVSDVGNESNMELENTIQTDLSTIDTVRTDLANKVLQQFADMSNTDAIDSIQTNILKELKTDTEITNKLKQDNKVEQTQKTDVPTSQPLQIQTPVPGANINSTLKTINETTSATIITSPFTQSNDINRTIQTTIANSVTQNFTHETVTQLSTAITLGQYLDIDISNIAGSVTLKDITNKSNIKTLSTLIQNLDIGTSIANSYTSNLGIKTDSSSTINRTTSASLADTANLRSNNTTSSSVDSTFSYVQSVTQSLIPSLGSLTSCCSLCCCLILISIISPMISNVLPGPKEKTETTTEGSSTESTEDTSTSEGGSSSSNR